MRADDHPGWSPSLCAAPAAAQATAADSWVTLGTRGGPIADAARSQPANALLRGRDVWLVDAGDGTASSLQARHRHAAGQARVRSATCTSIIPAVCRRCSGCATRPT